MVFHAEFGSPKIIQIYRQLELAEVTERELPGNIFVTTVQRKGLRKTYHLKGIEVSCRLKINATSQNLN